MLGLTTTSQAIPIDQTITQNNDQLPSDPILDQAFSFRELNTNPTSAASITFSVQGDFDGDNDNISLSVDELSFGTWLNRNLVDDAMTRPANDRGNQYLSILMETAVIHLVTFSGLVPDGNLDFLFYYFSLIENAPNRFGDFDPAQVRVQYEASSPAVPEPGATFLLGSGLVSLATWRYPNNTVKLFES